MFRSYVPSDEQLKEQKLPKARPESGKLSILLSLDNHLWLPIETATFLTNSILFQKRNFAVEDHIQDQLEALKDNVVEEIVSTTYYVAVKQFEKVNTLNG